MFSLKIKNLALYTAVVFGATSAGAATINSTDTAANGYSFVTSATYQDPAGGETGAASAILFLDGVDATTNLWSFTYKITNTSFSSGTSTAELGSWGFETSNPGIDVFAITEAPNVTYTGNVALPSSDTNWIVNTNLNTPSGNNPQNEPGYAIGGIDTCATSGSNCNGTGSNGFTAAQGEQTFKFSVLLDPTDSLSVDFDKSFFRFQSWNGDGSLKLVGDFEEKCLDGQFGGPDACVPPGGPGEVPLPAGMYLMLTVLGMGAYMRRRASNSA